MRAYPVGTDGGGLLGQVRDGPRGAEDDEVRCKRPQI